MANGPIGYQPPELWETDREDGSIRTGSASTCRTDRYPATGHRHGEVPAAYRTSPFFISDGHQAAVL